MYSKKQITNQSPLKDAFQEFAYKQTWAPNTLRAYEKNVDDLISFMLSVGVDPLLENVDYEVCMAWVKELKESFSPKSVQQKKATIVSMFSHYNKLGTVSSNPFSLVKIEINDDERHSEVLNIKEFFEVYKAAIELERDGTPVLISVHLSMFSALRNAHLGKLNTNSVSVEKGGVFLTFKKDKEKETDVQADEQVNLNRKNREVFVPLPPKLLNMLPQYIEENGLDGSLLYGLRGKPLGNKQLNYVVNRVSEHLGWAKKVKNDHGQTQWERKKSFTPHGFRYSLPTLFDEMGVSRESLQYLLGHSKFHLGNLRFYVLSDLKYVKELTAAQMVLETLLGVALELENYNIHLDLNVIYEELPKVLENQKKNKGYINLFKQSIIEYAMQKQQYEMMNPGNKEASYFTYVAPELPNQLFLQQVNGMPSPPYGHSFVHPMPQNNPNQVQGIHQHQHDVQHPYLYGHGPQGYQPYMQQYGMPANPSNFR